LEEIRNYRKIFGKVIDWLPKVYKNFQPFRPEAKYFEINYKSKSALIKYFLRISPSIRKRIGKIEIPMYENYKIKSFTDNSFNDLRDHIKIDEIGGSWVIKTNQLPSCEGFMMELKGDIDKNFMDRLVNIKPAVNKDSTQTYDKYWLDIMIRDVSILEKMYNKLNVSDIDCIVIINLEKHFVTDMPKQLVSSVNAFTRYMSAGLSADKSEVFRAWRRLRGSTRNWNLETMQNYIKDLTSKSVLKDYIKLDKPFYLGDIKNPESEKIIPTHFSVEALSNLTLEAPAAHGYLKFHKRKYQEIIKKEIGGDWKKFSKA